MMMPVATYAENRGRSESTVKAWIKKLNLELPVNPDDRRQRLISNQNQDLLDAHGKVKPVAPIAAAVEVIEVTPYQRSEETAMIIAEGEILKAQYLVPYQPVAQNPLLLALQRQTAEMQQANQARYAQIQQDIHTQREAQQTIAAAKRIKIMEAAQQEAFEAHQLKKQFIAQAETELELMDMGLGLPTPKPQSSPSQPVSVATSDELQPDWL
jgi:hypothetical protein